MATSLLALLDDIASTLDDIAAMTKVATKKTAGVLGDDLAVNAEQVSGVAAERELPVVWAVAMGSMKNKAILVPAALIISGFTPWAVAPLLMAGGAFLCFEAAEKVIEKLFHKAYAASDSPVVASEADKIKGAIRTDFILSAEIIVISLSTVADQDIYRQAAVLVGISLVMTVGVYGFVAAIVKLDDLGLYLSQKKMALQRSIGRGLLWFAPYLMRTLGVAGTIAMFLVGGGILAHALLHHQLEHTHAVIKILIEGGIGVLTGVVIAGVVTLYHRLRAPTHQ
jgi:predicted DNA repair protein MutK